MSRKRGPKGSSRVRARQMPLMLVATDCAEGAEYATGINADGVYVGIGKGAVTQIRRITHGIKPPLVMWMRARPADSRMKKRDQRVQYICFRAEGRARPEEVRKMQRYLQSLDELDESPQRKPWFPNRPSQDATMTQANLHQLQPPAIAGV